MSVAPRTSAVASARQFVTISAPWRRIDTSPVTQTCVRKAPSSAKAWMRRTSAACVVLAAAEDVEDRLGGDDEHEDDRDRGEQRDLGQARERVGEPALVGAAGMGEDREGAAEHEQRDRDEDLEHAVGGREVAGLERSWPAAT